MTVKYKNDFEKKKQFLLEHEDFFLKVISLRFSLTHQHLTKYKTILNWWYIVSNESINWTSEIMDEFKDLIFVPDDPFPEINTNESLPWSIEFIARYEDLWHWELLIQNKSVMNVPEIKKYFHNQLKPYIEEYSGHYNNQYDYIKMTFIEELEEKANNLRRYKEWQLQSIEEIDTTKDIDWLRLSQNEVLPWSAELIEKYVDKWDWSELIHNKSIPWSLELMKQFEDRIDWTVNLPNEDGETNLIGNSISANHAIEWDAEILSVFKKKLNNHDISISQCAKWDIDLLIQFSDFWEYVILSLNELVWNKVFPEFNNEDHLNSILDMILRKRNN